MDLVFRLSTAWSSRPRSEPSGFLGGPWRGGLIADYCTLHAVAGYICVAPEDLTTADEGLPIRLTADGVIANARMSSQIASYLLLCRSPCPQF